MAVISKNIDIGIETPITLPDEGDPVYDDGWEVTPKAGNTSGGRKLIGKNKGQAKFIYPLLGLTAGSVFSLKIDPDFSYMSQGAEGIILGFGWGYNEDFHFAGQVWDGSALNINTVEGDAKSNGSINPTITDKGLSENGSENGPNYIQIEISLDGLTYTLRTSVDGIVWDDEIVGQAPTPLSSAVQAMEFGVAGYIPGSNKGTISLQITELSAIYDDPAYIGGTENSNVNTPSQLVLALPAGTQFGDLAVCIAGNRTAGGGSNLLSGGGPGVWTTLRHYESGNTYDAFYKYLDGLDNLILQVPSPESGTDRGLLVMVFRNVEYVSRTYANAASGGLNWNSPDLQVGDLLAVMGVSGSFGELTVTGGNFDGPHAPPSQIGRDAEYGIGLTGVQACTSTNLGYGTLGVAIQMQPKPDI